jgi:sec-independent protein translocase protein TatB
MLGNLDPAKMLIILVLALVVIGPERLPKVARQAGAAWREVTRIREQVTEEVRSAIPELGDLPEIPRLKPGALSGFLNDLTKAPARSPGGAGAAAATGTSDESGAGVSELSGASWPDGAPAGALASSSARNRARMSGAARTAASGLTQRSTAAGVGDGDASGLDDPGMN